MRYIAKKLLITVQGPVENLLLKRYFGDFPHGAAYCTQYLYYSIFGRELP
jgi:hypothetical protein